MIFCIGVHKRVQKKESTQTERICQAKCNWDTEQMMKIEYKEF